MSKIRLGKFILKQYCRVLKFPSMNQDNHSYMSNQRHGQEKKERTSREDLTKKEENRMKEKIRDLTFKAPSKKVGNKRRASFCARMRGMKKKLTSAKTRDPDSRDPELGIANMNVSILKHINVGSGSSVPASINGNCCRICHDPA